MLIILVSLLFSCANAQNLYDDKYFTTSKVVKKVIKTKDLGNNPVFVPNKPMAPPVTPPISVTGSVLDILQTVDEVWTIVEKNKPVVKIDTPSYATALPAISDNNWMAVGGWRPEHNYTYSIAYENLYGMTTVYFEYQVKLIYGGSVDGKGLYIAAARVIPKKVRVMWGYDLDVKVTVPKVFNVRTPENPLAAMLLNVEYTVKTILNEDITTDSYQLQGDGAIIDSNKGKTLVSASVR